MNILDLGRRAFMRFWYPYVGFLNRIWPSITIAGTRITVKPGVYKPLENEHACADYCPPNARVLDLGCGSGVNSVFVAPKAREVLAVDISQPAVENTKENCERLGLTNVTVRQSDMFSAVDGKFDLILANPPYVPVEFEDEREQFATSTRYLPNLFANARKHLAKDGKLLVQFPIWVKKDLARMARQHGFELLSVTRTPLKSPGLFLLSLAYMQVGFRSAYYLFV